MAQADEAAAASGAARSGAAAKGGGSRKGVLIGAAGGLALGAGAFFLLYSGLVDVAPLSGSDRGEAAGAAPLEPIGFIPLEPIVISLPRGSAVRTLRFLGQLEVTPEHAEDVVALMPRIQDALNTYLRAVEVRDLEEPGATVWLRAQMLRRVQVVVGEGRVRDILIGELVLN